MLTNLLVSAGQGEVPLGHMSVLQSKDIIEDAKSLTIDRRCRVIISKEGLKYNSRTKMAIWNFCFLNSQEYVQSLIVI